MAERVITFKNKYSFSKEREMWSGLVYGWYLAAKEKDVLCKPFGKVIRKELRIISERPYLKTWEGEAEVVTTMDSVREYSSVAVSVTDGSSALILAAATFKLEKPKIGFVRSEYFWISSELRLGPAAVRNILNNLGGACAMPWDYGSPLEVIIEGR